MTLAPGTRFGPYELLSVLGAGGMGEVYRARDPHLERDVAIKVLAPALARDRAAVARFEREARTVSSLNHPHIVHIYDIGETETPSGPSRYIAMELVEGETVRVRLRRGQRWPELIEWLGQVADALARAHRAGIIHRDLKPENIMIAGDGYAKVVDFGLAKLTERSPASDELTIIQSELTETGMLVGTVAYMSPEQAQGRPVDARSDVFSFGCILYEVAAGRQPFTGETSVATLHAIAYEDPLPLESLNPSTPLELRRIIARSLAKDPVARYQSMADVAADLRAFSRTTGADAATVGPTIKTPSPRASAMTTRRTVIGWVALGAVMAVVGTLVGNRMRRDPRSEPARTQPQIHVEKATNRGTINRVALSRDGRYIAYTTFNDRRNTIWLRDLTEKTDVRLVGSSVEASPYEFRELSFRFARNGQALFYAYSQPNGVPVLFKVSLVGGESRLVRDGSSLRGLSPDDRRLEFIRSEGGKRKLVVADLDSAQELELADVTDAPVTGWLPDGKHLLVTRPIPQGHAFVLVSADGQGERRIGTESRTPLGGWWNEAGSAMVYAVDPSDGTNPTLQLMVLDASTGKTTTLGNRQWRDVGFALSWVPSSNELVVSESDLGTNGRAVWLLSYPDGKASRISPASSLGWESLSFSGDGTKFAAVEQHDRSDLLVADDPARTFNRIAGGTDVSLTLSWTRSRQIVHSANDAGRYDLYVMDADGSNRTRLTFDRESDETEPAATADGKYIVFVSNRTGERALYRINSDGTGLKTITSPVRNQSDGEPRVTPDSKWIIYQHWDNGPTLWRVSIDGGTPTLIKGIRPAGPAGYEMAYGASPSPDGQSLAFFYFSGNPSVGRPWSSTDLVVSDAEGRISKRFFVRDNPQGAVVSDERVEWSADGRALYYRQLRDGASNIWMQPAKGGPAVQVTRFDGTLFTTGALQTFAWSLDGKTLAYTRSTSTADVVVVSSFR